MAAPKLVNGQREALLRWLAADYDIALIRKWFQDHEWPFLSKDTVCYYRKRHRDEIEQLRAERHAKALNTGLAIKEERVERLKKHADELEAIKWVPDEKGRLWNEKAWRETLDDIAKEMGERKTVVDMRIVRDEAERIAKRLGLDPAAVLAEAERIVSARV